MTYFSVSGSHTIIGAARFHGRVREGVGWFPRAGVARRRGVEGAQRATGRAGPTGLGVRGSSRTVD